MSKRKIYISGPMTGIEPREYRRRFGEAEKILRRHGYGVINPCLVWACRWPWIYRAMEWVLGKRWAYAVVLCYDLLLLMTRADGIVMLPGWQASRGAQIENYVAFHFPMMGIDRAAREEIGSLTPDPSPKREVRGLRDDGKCLPSRLSEKASPLSFRRGVGGEAESN